MTWYSSLINGAIGMISGAIAQNKTFENNKVLMGLQNRYNKDAANHTNELQKNMWDYTNTENQVQHLKNAGLNPALIYGQSGGGGMGVTGSAQQQGTSIAQDSSVAMGLQAAVLASQIDLNAAKADEARAGANEKEESAKEKGWNMRKIEKELNLIDANTDLARAKKVTEESQQKLNDSLRDVNGSVIKLNNEKAAEALANVALIKQKELTEKQITEIKKWDRKLQEETFDDQVSKAAWTVTDIMAGVQLKDSQQDLNREQAAKFQRETELLIQKTITEGWTQKEIEQKIENYKNDILVKKWHMVNESADVLMSGVSNIITSLLPWKGIFSSGKNEAKTVQAPTGTSSN